MKKLRVKRERPYSAHHALLEAAYAALKSPKKAEGTVFHHELVCMTFCALALEAIANTFGECLIDDWKDFESASPIAKLRTICSKLGVNWDKQHEPFATAIWLSKFRNKVAHAKPEIVSGDIVMPEIEYWSGPVPVPASRLEKDVTLDNANRAVEQVRALNSLLIEKTPSEQRSWLVADVLHGNVKAEEG